MKSKKSPCIDICKFNGKNGWCLGCGRTKIEARKWKNLKPYDIKTCLLYTSDAADEE